jgi:hypothetical protein
MNNPIRSSSILVAILILLPGIKPLLSAATSGTMTVFQEAEAGAPAAPAAVAPPAGSKGPSSFARELEGASGGKVLESKQSGYMNRQPGPALTIPAAGRYRVWIRYFKAIPDSARLLTLIREEGDGATMGYSILDFKEENARILSETPYVMSVSNNEGKKGFVWDSFGVTFERPMRITLDFSAGQVDCILLTSDQSLDPRTVDVAKLSSLATADANAKPDLGKPSGGFVWSPGLPCKPDAYAGIAEIDKRFWAGLINCGSIYVDGARMIHMGFNRDHNHMGQPYEKWGIKTMSLPMEAGSHVDPAFAKAHPSPEGRFVNNLGQVGGGFSIHFQPWVEADLEGVKRSVKEQVAEDDGGLGFWRISAEEGGWLDYSSWAVEAFRKWLQEKHGTIETLNKRWGTTYKGFAEVNPAKTYEESHASWLEFREFCGHSYAVSVGRRIPIIQSLDPKRRPCLGANSNLDIAVPYFMAFRPNDFEELIRVGLKDEKYISYDIYCADDDMGSSTDFFHSLGQGRKLFNQEFSNHVTDPRIAARTYWMQVAKGIHGINLFMFQDGPGDGSYPKWALAHRDGTPKQKLGAYTDAVQEVHRLEPLLMAANCTHAVKPVALYWSRIDIGLDKPHDSWYGGSFNSPLHVYGTLRGLGYPVRWITPRQIAEGELEQVGALVLSGCDHIPQAAAAKIESWVKGGGVVMADSWPGAFDEYGQPQITLAPIFGVRPIPKNPVAAANAQIKLQESKQGYGEVTDAASLREKYYEKIDEMAQLPGATHPVAVTLGDFMLAGYAPDNIECVAGKLVAMTHRRTPGAIVNEYGKGQSLYSAFQLGTIYEAAPTRYEWDSMHTGSSYARFLDAFLKYAGVKPGSAISGLPERIVAKLRIESPLVTPDGNVLIGLTSMNDDIVKPFDLSVRLPKGIGEFKHLYVVTEGTRLLQAVKFEVKDATLKLRIPEFDTHAMIVAVKSAPPLVSLELKGVRRGPASLAVIEPGQIFTIEAVVHNPSPKVLPKGKLRLTTPAGWQQSALEIKIGSIDPGEAARGTLKVRAPAIAGTPRLEPLLTQYEADQVRSTPSTEMVWWGASERSFRED